MQEGRCDCAADGENPYENRAGAPVWLQYRPDNSAMSDMKEALAVKEGFESGHVCVGDMLGNPHGRRTGMVTKEVLGDVYLLAKRLVGSGLIVGGDDLDVTLKADNGKGPLRVEEAISEMKVDGDSEDGEGLEYVNRGGVAYAPDWGILLWRQWRSLWAG